MEELALAAECRVHLLPEWHQVLCREILQNLNILIFWRALTGLIGCTSWAVLVLTSHISDNPIAAPHFNQMTAGLFILLLSFFSPRLRRQNTPKTKKVARRGIEPLVSSVKGSGLFFLNKRLPVEEMACVLYLSFGERRNPFSRALSYADPLYHKATEPTKPLWHFPSFLQSAVHFQNSWYLSLKDGSGRLYS